MKLSKEHVQRVALELLGELQEWESVEECNLIGAVVEKERKASLPASLQEPYVSPFLFQPSRPPTFQQHLISFFYAPLIFLSLSKAFMAYAHLISRDNSGLAALEKRGDIIREYCREGRSGDYSVYCRLKPKNCPIDPL